MTPTETARIQAIRGRLLDHYDQHRRDLPWRDDGDPYRIWISEVMLQQTRVETVIPYYRRWIERFPGVDELAAARQEEVLQEWKGLGYYSRARNLHRAARMVRDRYGGRLPTSLEELRGLPGVGAYTAGAVASIAFGAPVPAVDGNVRRVLSRLHDLEDPGAVELRKRAAALVDPTRPGCFNQAVMELGATICSPSSPSCVRCPVEDLCLARARGTVAERPPVRKRGAVGRRRIVVAVPVDRHGRTLLVRRPTEGLLGGMWEFPATEADGETGRDAATDEGETGAVDGRAGEVLSRRAAEGRGVALPGAPGVPLEPVDHRFTHLHVTYHPYLFAEARLPGNGDAGEEGVRRASLDALGEHPLPVAQQKIGARARRMVAGLR